MIDKNINDCWKNFLNNKVCCFTGYRPQKCPWKFDENDKRYIKVKKQIEKEIKKAILNGYNTFICGMAIGFDLTCAEIVLKLKNKFKNIILIGALPCKTQSHKWNLFYKEKYNKLINQLDGIRCIHDKYQFNCMQERNKFMIDNSSLCIALFDGKKGGTKQTIEYAKLKKIKIVYIDL